VLMDTNVIIEGAINLSTDIKSPEAQLLSSKTPEPLQDYKDNI